MRKVILALLLSLLATNAVAKFNPNQIAYTTEVDEKAILLGLGLYVQAGYTKAIYICPEGGDDALNDGLTPATPYKTWYKARTLWNSQPAGAVFAFCRGHTFYETTPTLNSANANATKDTPITVRDYQRTQDKETAPAKVIMNYPLANDYFLNLANSGQADSFSGVVIENLDISSLNPKFGTAIWGYNDIDYVTIRNNYIHHMNSGINISTDINGTGATNRVPLETISDLTFTSVPAGPDTITRATGIWNAAIKPGDAIVISGSTSNNKIFRIETRVSDTVLSITEGKLWEVVNESNTPSVSVTINRSDTKNSHWDIGHNKIAYTASGAIFGTLAKSSVHDNILSHNGYNRSNLDHNFYFSTSDDFIVKNNILTNNAPYHGGKCDSTSIVMHGNSHWGVIQDNLLFEADENVNGQCYGIAFDNGYLYYEEFTDFRVTGNTLLNMGGIGIGCNACQRVEIDHNEIYYKTTTGGGSGIAVPDRSLNTQYGNPVSKDINIHDNTIKGIGAAPMARTNTNFAGIRIGTGSDVANNITISNNIIDNFYSCIKPEGDGSGATVAPVGNITTNCASGLQP